MAGDWIKLEHTTPDKPEVIRMATALRMDQDEVVGKLIRIWVWANQNSVDGNSIPITAAFLDRLTSKRGFAAAMREVNWLVGDDGALTFPSFERHNGESAKCRAQTNRRVVAHREQRTSNAPSVTDVTPAPLQKPESVTLPTLQKPENVTLLTLQDDTDVTLAPLQKPLPEKRREENIEYQKTPIVPLKGTPKGPLQLRAEAIFHRRPDTPLTVAEERAFKKNASAIEASSEADWLLLESFYAAPQTETYARKDLATLVNNWNGEIDRARAWATRSTKRIANPYQIKATTDEEHAKGF